MAEIKFISKENLLYVWQKVKLLLANKVDKANGMGLSHNDLTDELKEKILSAGDSSFTGNYADLTGKPTKLSEFTNDSGFQTEVQVNTAINNAVANINKKTVVTSIEEMTDANTIYLIANTNAESNNVYDEYIVINGQTEKIGTTEVDLTNCVKTSDLVEVTNEEIDEIFAE